MSKSSLFDRELVYNYLTNGLKSGVFEINDRKISVKLPPIEVVLRARRAKTLSEQYGILCDYYGVPKIRAVKNYRLPNTIWARFITTDPPRIEVRGDGLQEEISMHEFAHYLRFCVGADRDSSSENEEEAADEFAEAVVNLR